MKILMCLIFFILSNIYAQENLKEIIHDNEEIITKNAPQLMRFLNEEKDKQEITFVLKTLGITVTTKIEELKNLREQIKKNSKEIPSLYIMHEMLQQEYSEQESEKYIAIIKNKLKQKLEFFARNYLEVEAEQIFKSNSVSDWLKEVILKKNDYEKYLDSEIKSLNVIYKSKWNSKFQNSKFQNSKYKKIYKKLWISVYKTKIYSNILNKSYQLKENDSATTWLSEIKKQDHENVNEQKYLKKNIKKSRIVFFNGKKQLKIQGEINTSQKNRYDTWTIINLTNNRLCVSVANNFDVVHQNFEITGGKIEKLTTEFNINNDNFITPNKKYHLLTIYSLKKSSTVKYEIEIFQNHTTEYKDELIKE